MKFGDPGRGNLGETIGRAGRQACINQIGRQVRTCKVHHRLPENEEVLVSANCKTELPDPTRVLLDVGWF